MSLPEALEHLRAGRPQAAAALLTSLVESRPTNADAWFLLGACRHALNELSEAASAFSRSLRLNPGNAEAHFAHITVLRALGQRHAALEASRKALNHLSSDARALYAMALCLEDLGRADEALTHYDTALSLNPALEDALHNRGLLLSRLGRFEEAEENQRLYISRFPKAARAHGGHADVLVALGHFEEALQALETTERLAPDDPSSLVRRGVALAALRRYAQARAAFAEAKSRDAQAVDAYLQRVVPGADTEHVLLPENLFLWQAWLAMGRCDWSSWSAAADEARQLCANTDASIDPAVGFVALHLPLTGKERHAVAQRIAARIEGKTSALPPPGPRARSRVRIGVLSPDLREHIMGHLLLPFFELLDRERFELYAYSLIADNESEVGNRLRSAAREFCELHSFTDEQAAARLHEDNLDVLLDVGGYTTGSRFGITARRPARVQVLYLGFAGSLGSKRVDYVLSDSTAGVSPAEFSETPLCLPHTYHLYDFREPTPDAPVSRQEYGLAGDAFVFCAFHRPEKISPDSFQLWMKVLHQVRNAVLWFFAVSPIAQRNLRQAATAEGIAPERLVFAPFEPRGARYLARHRLGDLMLDALHHNAIASACDALAAALPVLTVRGSSMASRSGESLLRAAGLPELVAQDKDAFVATAVALASDREKLEGYRRTLAARRSPLFDTAGRVRELENALLETLQRRRA